MALKPQVSGMGISSQDNGAQELQGTYTTRPMPGYIGQNKSFVVDPGMGNKQGQSMYGKANGRRK